MWTGLPWPPPGKCCPEATFTIDLFVDGPSLGQVLGNGLRKPFHYRFIRGRAFPGPLPGKWPPEATFTIDLFVDGPSLGHFL